MSLKVYNSLTRQREDFIPLDSPRVGIYVCGPTVYGHSHLGHAKSYVSFDTIVRWLRTPPPLGPGYTVNYVQNITDVGHLTDNTDEGEDKIVAEARRRGLHPMAVAETFLQSYLEDMDALHARRPDIMPRASGHIPEQIEQARALIARGHAYEVRGSVYFSISSYPEYGKLSGRRFEQMEAGARVEINPEKRHPADFALWKRAEPGHIMRWPSPWGEGYPGWHIECSAMSAKYLGPTFDIHGGGIENQFPHHECEIAQHECATGRPFARYWLHNNMCTLEGQKMGKSLGNSISLKDLFYGREGGVVDAKGSVLLDRTFEPVVVRHFILTSHYRQPLDFSSTALRAAESGSCRLRDALRELSAAAQQAPPAPPRPQVSEILEDVRSRFAQAMNEDFNTAAAIAVVFDFARQTSAWVTAGLGREDLLATELLMRQMTCDVLGFRWSNEDRGRAAEQRDQLIRILVELRSEARKARNFALSDQIREQLAAAGVHLQDGPTGTTW